MIEMMIDQLNQELQSYFTCTQLKVVVTWGGSIVLWSSNWYRSWHCSGNKKKKKESDDSRGNEMGLHDSIVEKEFNLIRL